MKKITIILGIILAISVVSGSCYAQNYANSLIWGCVQKNKGNLRIVDGPNSCNPSEVAISWNGNGPGVVASNSVNIDCSQGQSVSQALENTPGSPLTITIKGICNENITIIRDDVTLIADPSGGGVNGIDPNSDTIRVRASRTIIDGLTITGGYNGINVGGSATIRNCMVQSTRVNGVTFYHGGHGTVDKCTIQNNNRHGILVEAASATITSSTISSNAATGIKVMSGGGARIGIPDHSVGATAYAGNTISNNGSSGIDVFDSAGASIGGNTISGNGTDPNASFGQFGIFVHSANADIVGKNTITGNVGSGILLLSGATVFIGDSAWGLPTDNTISGNGFGLPTNPGGILAFMGTSLDIRNATITGNANFGMLLNFSSYARMRGDTVDNGIVMENNSGLRLQDPVVTVTGGLRCSGNSHYTSDSDISKVSGGSDGCSPF
jgi:parallel beta-helix repeat protein